MQTFGVHLWLCLEPQNEPVLWPRAAQRLGWLRAFLVSGLRLRILQPVLLSLTLQMFRVSGKSVGGQARPPIWAISWAKGQVNTRKPLLPAQKGRPTHFCLWPQAKHSSIYYFMPSLLGAIGGQEGRAKEEIAESKFVRWCF